MHSWQRLLPERERRSLNDKEIQHVKRWLKNQSPPPDASGQPSVGPNMLSPSQRQGFKGSRFANSKCCIETQFHKDGFHPLLPLPQAGHQLGIN